jgi:hypothetical protein
MRTSLPPEKLAALHAEGHTKTSRFVNPHTVARCERILRERGEEWAQSVLLRRFDRRSRISPASPWLNSGEDEILVLADDAEWAQLTAGLR